MGFVMAIEMAVLWPGETYTLETVVVETETTEHAEVEEAGRQRIYSNGDFKHSVGCYMFSSQLEERATYIKEVKLELTNETVEIHRCPACNGVVGVDASFLDQVDTQISCPICTRNIKLSDPEREG